MTGETKYAARDVYFPIEVASREYSGHIVLGVALALRGFTATLGYKGAVGRAMEEASLPGVLFYKNYRKVTWAHLVARAVGQDPEGGFTSTRFGDFFAWRSGLQMAESADAYFCYGQDDYEFLREALPAANVCLTGSPRVMLWGEAAKLFYADQIQQIRARYGDFVLIASSGARGNPRYLKEEAEGRLGDERRAILERDDMVANEMLHAARHLARETKRRVVIRPHPAEDLEIWRQAVSQDPGVSLETCFDLAAWIHSADAVIHRTSTAGMEAAVASVPTISYAESEERLERDMVAMSTATPDQVSVRVVGPDSLCAEVEKVTRGSGSSKTSEGVRSILQAKFRYPLEEAPALICEEIERLGPWAPVSGLSVDRRRDLLVRSQSAWRDDERVGVADRPFGSKRRPFRPGRVAADVRNALRLLGADGTVHVRFRERDCFTLFCR